MVAIGEVRASFAGTTTDRRCPVARTLQSCSTAFVTVCVRAAAFFLRGSLEPVVEPLRQEIGAITGSFAGFGSRQRHLQRELRRRAHIPVLPAGVTGQHLVGDQADREHVGGR